MRGLTALAPRRLSRQCIHRACRYRPGTRSLTAPSHTSAQSEYRMPGRSRSFEQGGNSGAARTNGESTGDCNRDGLLGPVVSPEFDNCITVPGATVTSVRLAVYL